jgi:putative transposase
MLWPGRITVTDAEDNTEQMPAAGLDVQLAAELIERARAQGVSLVGPDGLLAGITKTVLQAALDAEMTEHLGYEKGERPARPGGNHRNGRSPKTVLTEVGSVPLQVPRDRAGEFEPKIVPKHARRIAGFDEAIVSLYAKGLTTGEIRAHLAEIYDVEVSRDLISRVTDRVAEELAEWQSRPLEAVYPVVLIDAIHVKIRDGQVANRPIDVAVGINCHGERDALGLWGGHRRRRRQALDERAGRAEEPRHRRCVHRLLRRAQRPARGDQPDLAPGHRPTMRCPPDL